MDFSSAEEGFVYGRAPDEPEDVLDAQLMLDAVGVPKGEGLPHPLEWYDGAKDREKARCRERDELLLKKNVLRQQWAELVWDDLGNWQELLSGVSMHPDPLPHITELLARAVHERPGDSHDIQVLHQTLAAATENERRLGDDLTSLQKELRRLEDAVRAQESFDQAEEEARLELKRQDDERRARMDAILRRHEAQLRGEELPPEPLLDEAPQGQLLDRPEAVVGASVAVGRPGPAGPGGTESPARAATPSSPSRPGPLLLAPVPAVRGAVAPTPGLSAAAGRTVTLPAAPPVLSSVASLPALRSGPARGLPPLVHPPPPAVLGSGGGASTHSTCAIRVPFAQHIKTDAAAAPVL